MPKPAKSFDIGIIGGGQLARMMLLKGHELGLSLAVLSESPNDPAAQVTSAWFKGSVNTKPALRSFLRKVKILTYESEFVRADLLAPMLKSCGTKSFPKVQHMSILQQRFSQKAWLDENRIATSPWLNSDRIDGYEDAVEIIGTKKLVLKKNMGGYDGYGTFIVKNRHEFDRVHRQLAEQNISFVAEAFIPFKRELAVTFARSSNGHVVAYPIVESFQTDSRCDWVKGPIRSKKAETMIRKIKTALTKAGYVGVIAFEMFEKTNGELLVNEIAPRVHNSSHYSLNGFNEDQFSMHLKAILGRDLVKPSPDSGGFAMKNLIGSGVKNLDLKTNRSVHLHWYGKTENRKGRKMGHLNCVARSPDLALKLVQTAAKDMKV